MRRGAAAAKQGGFLWYLSVRDSTTEVVVSQFEAAGDFEEWPKNVPGKPTQVAVFGMYHNDRGKLCEILWTGKFPDLDKAMYWGAKKELEAIKRRGWMIASRVLWQHDLSPEQAVDASFKRMEPQMDAALSAALNGYDPGIALGGNGDPNAPLKPVDYSKAKGFVIDIEGPEHDDDGFIPDDPREP
jgi:hypothetical protein